MPVLKITLRDSSGTIQGIFFNDVGLSFDSKILLGKTYLFSKGKVKTTNKRFSSDDYEIVFENYSVIREVDQDIQDDFSYYKTIR